jgi:hypothetical protein
VNYLCGVPKPRRNWTTISITFKKYGMSGPATYKIRNTTRRKLPPNPPSLHHCLPQLPLRSLMRHSLQQCAFSSCYPEVFPGRPHVRVLKEDHCACKMNSTRAPLIAQIVIGLITYVLWKPTPLGLAMKSTSTFFCFFSVFVMFFHRYTAEPVT